MAYTINLTDGNIFATVADGTINTSSSVTLVGKNYAGYGEFLDENFIQMLENFSNPTAPVAPLTGQLWWDKTNSLLKVYNGTIFKTISAATSSASAPASNVTGDLWYDTTSQQLNVWTGSAFLVVGPAYSSSTGVAGAIPETINAANASPQFVTTVYSANTRVAIYNDNPTFTAAAPVSSLFPTVYKGMTMSNASGTNISGNLIGAGNVIITTASSNAVATFTGTGANITGYTTVSGNVTGGNILTAGQVSATGNVTGANFIGNVIPPAGGAVSTTGNITGGNILTSGLVSATGTVTGSSFLGSVVSVTANVTGGNIRTGGLVSATANVTGGNILTGGVVSATANITGGNILTGGLISATANVSGNYFIGNGSQLTGLSAAVSVSQIQNGTSNVRIAATDGNVTIGVNSTAVAVFNETTLFINSANVVSIGHTGTNAVGNIGSSAQYFNQTFTDRVNATTLSASGNVTGGNVLTGGLISATGAITGGAITGTSLTVSTGNISGGNINNNNSNGVGNIGSSTTYFNRVFAQATTALYADVAERFAADEVLEAGTVVELGGTAEITRSLTELSENVFGVISTRAAYLMNGGAGEDDTHPPVAMTGRVPVKVVGTVRKGDRLVSAGAGIARAARPGESTAFNVIGRSLVDKTTPESGTIEAIVTIKN
jgi:hypothetical protein